MALQLGPIITVMLAVSAGLVQAAESPAGIESQIPAGYVMLDREEARFTAGKVHATTIVALAKRGEVAGAHGQQPAPARPLLLFLRQADGSYRLSGRNDRVVFRADEGGQCDPFLESGYAMIAVKGPYFTIENGVACGQHWTDFITFRFDAALGTYVFDNERRESWSMNRSDDPGADALVQDGPQEIRRGDRDRPVTFDTWRPSR